MLELASVGAKVLQTRSVGLAMREGVRVQVLSSFADGPAVMEGHLPGSLVVDEDEIVEKKLVTGIATRVMKPSCRSGAFRTALALPQQFLAP